jgi:hypothetical protein
MGCDLGALASRWTVTSENAIKNTIVEWHRPLARRALGIPLAIGAVLMTIGGLCILVSLPRATSFPTLALVGAACVVTAPVSVIFTLIMRVGVDKCLIIRTDAVVMQRESEETLVAWDEVESVKCEDQILVIHKKDGTTLRIEEPFSEPEKIAARMEEVKRKSGFGLI